MQFQELSPEIQTKVRKRIQNEVLDDIHKYFDVEVKTALYRINLFNKIFDTNVKIRIIGLYTHDINASDDFQYEVAEKITNMFDFAVKERLHCRGFIEDIAVDYEYNEDGSII